MSIQNPTSARFSIRKARSGDCDGILECLAAAFASVRDSYTREAFLDTVLTPDTVKKRLQDMVVLVALLNNGDVIGTISCKVVNEDEGHLRGMAVRPEWHGSPVAAELLARAEEEFRKAGCSAITLDTTEPLTRAMRFYEKQGFGLRGELPNFSACGSWNIGSILPSDSECLAQSHFWQVSTHPQYFQCLLLP
jgi:N-acetylglutamate synthase-like GNAT family acetyltransferase